MPQDNKRNNLYKTVYGPVPSWRYGMSVGIDPIFEISTCSFNCIYCQLGNIQRHTVERKEYVQTHVIRTDFQEFLETAPSFDVITFSGSGEPTLASNLAAMIHEIKVLSPQTPVFILTNSLLLSKADVQKDLMNADRVIAKLDAVDDLTLRTINRPAIDIHIDEIVAGISEFRGHYDGILELQIMLMAGNIASTDRFLSFIEQIQPDLIHLNLPSRPYPSVWHRENRGRHEAQRDYKVSTIRSVGSEQAQSVKRLIENKTSIPVSLREC